MFAGRVESDLELGRTADGRSAWEGLRRSVLSRGVTMRPASLLCGRDESGLALGRTTVGRFTWEGSRRSVLFRGVTKRPASLSFRWDIRSEGRVSTLRLCMVTGLRFGGRLPTRFVGA